jgi:hypothetical protein
MEEILQGEVWLHQRLAHQASAFLPEIQGL